MRAATPGETFTLQSGFSITVPRGYRGSYVQSLSLDVLDGLVSETVDTANFSSVSEERGAMFKWPLIATSADGTVEVRHLAVRHTAVTSIIVRVPGHPTGVVTFSRRGKQAAKDPGAVVTQAESVWQRFAVQGITLPKVEL